EALRAEVLGLDSTVDLAAEVAAEAGSAAAPELTAPDALAVEPLVAEPPPADEPVGDSGVAEGLALESAASAAGIDLPDTDDEADAAAAPLPFLDLGDEDEPVGVAAPGFAEEEAEPVGVAVPGLPGLEEEPAEAELDPEARAQADADEAIERARELVASGRTAEAVEELDAEQRRLADAGHLTAA